jgi:hypothetical protein
MVQHSDVVRGTSQEIIDFQTAETQAFEVQLIELFVERGDQQVLSYVMRGGSQPRRECRMFLRAAAFEHSRPPGRLLGYRFLRPWAHAHA